MNTHRIRSSLCALVSTASVALCALAGIARADEAEIFVGTGNVVSSQRPNILFIMDTSGSMSEDTQTQVPYDPATNFPGNNSCDGRIFYRQGSNSSDPPSCNDSNSVPAALFKCSAGLQQILEDGFYVAAQAAQWRANNAGTKRWRNINGSNTADAWVECRADAGVHGNGVNLTRVWASDSNGPWSDNSAQQIGWNQNGAGDGYVFYSGNYIKWLNSGGTIIQSRLEIMQQVASETIDQLAVSDSVNMGLMRFSTNTNQGCDNTAAAEGGMVLREMGAVAANAAVMKADIAALNADGCTPLSEAMYEAYLYLSGSSVDYGLASKSVAADVSPPTLSPGVNQFSIASSRQASPSQNTYQSPLLESCQRNFIVLLTDGLPTSDSSANTEIQALIGRSCTPGTGQGRCLEEIAEYMYENDLRPSLPGIQNATTYTIGFGPEVNNAPNLQNTASAGGGVFYEASDTATLSTVLTNIVHTILDVNTSFTAPAVSVNAFNRTQNLNDLYVTVFRPSETFFWDGNIKKYSLNPAGFIEDAANQPAVEVTTGFFRTTSQSFWSTGTDGDNVTLGGAANELPDPANRNVYTDLNTGIALTAAGNTVNTANAAITVATLGLGATENPGRDALINWMRGADVSDANGDGSSTDARHSMGDPMNGRPATVIYGGSVATPDPDDGVVYAVTNEGYLHAIDSDDGSELWAFMPNQLLSRARDLFTNESVDEREYGLDGNVRVIRNEINDNGVIEPALGERVMIYFGMRRGGGDYFGLDVTDRNVPTFLFRIGPNEAGTKLLKNAGQSWSTPSVAKVNIASAAQNSLQQVLVFGGGYDTSQDNGAFTASDANGNQIFMVDAVSGNVLWYAGPSTDAAADLAHVSMLHSIPADIRIFDLTGDGFADRMYAADMGGRVWRFDIHNGQDRTSLVTGGVFASLGNAHLGAHPNSSTRRFYSAPDVAFLSDGGKTWLNIAIGSGYRGHPLNLDTQDRFYSLRDFQAFARLTQDQYDDATVVTEADLLDITTDIDPTLAATATGWRLDLRRAATGNWTGEKSLTEARTIQNMIQFTTYEPNSDSTPSANACSPAPGLNRLYTISAFTGAPVFDLESATDPDADDDGDGTPNGAEDDDGDGTPNSSDGDDDGDGVPDANDADSIEDRDSELAQSGIAPEVVWLFPSPDNPEDCEGAECRPDPVCLVGLESCGVGVNLNPVRTYWRQTGVN